MKDKIKDRIDLHMQTNRVSLERMKSIIEGILDNSGEVRLSQLQLMETEIHNIKVGIYMAWELGRLLDSDYYKKVF